MVWLLIGLTLGLVLAPIRRLVFSHWLIVLPALAGLYLGLRFALGAVASGAPAALLLIIPLLGAAEFIGAFRGMGGNRRRDGRDDEQRDNDRR